MTLWRPPRSMGERTARAVRSMQSGSIDGRIVSARPVSNTNEDLEDEEYDDEEIEYEQPLPPIDREILDGLTPWTDQFTKGGTVLSLTYNPYRHPKKTPDSEKQKVSLHVYWNGVFQEDSTYQVVYSDVSKQTYVILNKSPKHKRTDIITCKYWYYPPNEDDDSDQPLLIGTYVKGTGSMGPLPFFNGGWVQEPVVGDPESSGSFQTMQYGCLARGMPNVTMGIKTLGRKIPINLHPDYKYYWFIDGTHDAGIRVAGGSSPSDWRIACQYPGNCRDCCGFEFDKECGPLVCLGPEHTGGSWVVDGLARTNPGSTRIVVTGVMAKALAIQANNNTAVAYLDSPGWGPSTTCMCTMFETCVDGSIWGYSGVASYGVHFWLGVSLIITKDEIELENTLGRSDW